MNHLNTLKKPFLVSDVLEKLPNNLSKMSIFFSREWHLAGFLAFPLDLQLIY